MTACEINISMLNLLKINVQLRDSNFSEGNGYYMQEVRLEFGFFQPQVAYSFHSHTAPRFDK